MPAELTFSKQQRTAARKRGEHASSGIHPTGTVEVGYKRNRAEVSCAECRRLKIKCDKQLPCKSCSRRGCASICPNGSLATGQGTRFVLAATQHLHQRRAAMAARVRELEVALATLQARYSSEPHPLLKEESASSPGPSHGSTDDPSSRSHSEGPTTKPLLKAFGTLSIADHGLSRYFGPTGGTERMLVHAPQDEKSTPASSTGPNSPDSGTVASEGSTPPWQSRSTSALTTYFSRAFPFSPVGTPEEVRSLMEGHLPEFDRAKYLCHTYNVNMSWTFPGFPRERVNELFLLFYPDQDSLETPQTFVGPHKLALMFLIFAVAALVDLAQRAINDEAEHYFQIARVAISQQTLLQLPSLATIEMLVMLSTYYSMTGADSLRMETSWSLISMASRFALTIGLHRDSARWGLPHLIVQRRRALFNSIFAMDNWQSLNTGRSPSFCTSYIDCCYPGEGLGINGSAAAALHGNFPFRWARDVVYEIASKTLTAHPPSYSIILELDRKVRDFPLPDVATLPRHPDDTDAVYTLRQCIIAHHRAVMIIYIHRSFFAEALLRNSNDPIASPFHASFLASYRAAKVISREVRKLFEVYPELTGRFWQIWTFTFSSAIIFGSIVTHSPRSSLASNAMAELELMCALFSEASMYSRRASKALPILLKLREKAAVMIKVEDREQSKPWPANWDETEDELSILAGQTKLVTKEQSGLSEQLFAEVTAEGAWGRAAYPQHSPDDPLPAQRIPLQPYLHSYQPYQMTQPALPAFASTTSYNMFAQAPSPSYAYNQWPLAVSNQAYETSGPSTDRRSPFLNNPGYDAYGRLVTPVRPDHRWNGFMQDARLFGNGQ